MTRRLHGAAARSARPRAVCLACGGSGLSSVLNLGCQAPANELLAKTNEPWSAYPLELVRCPACGHGQLAHFIPPAELFRHYVYASGVSGTLRAYFTWFRDALELPPDARVLELACNDGSLLEMFKGPGRELLGVDPATNLAETARARGLEVVDGFWPCPQAVAGRRFDLVIAMNVLAHNPDPQAFLAAVAEVLDEEGLCVVQTSQALMLANGEFDTVYHEHYSFFTARSMAALASRVGLELRETLLTDIHGVSTVFLLTRPGARRRVATGLAEGRFAIGPGHPARSTFAKITGEAGDYARFAQSAQARMAEVVHLVADARREGRRIACVGAAAKALTFLRAAGIAPDHLYDEADLKIGHCAPGLDAVIEPLDAIAEAPGPLLVILSAWNFAEELTAKVRARRTGRGDRIVVYFPQIADLG